MTETVVRASGPLPIPRGFAAGFAALLVLLPLAHVRGGQSTVVGVLVLCLLGWLVRAGIAVFRDLPVNLCVAMGAWAVFATASAMWSPEPLLSLEYAGQTIWLPIAMGLLAFRLGADPAARRMAIQGACIGLAVLTIATLGGVAMGARAYLSSGVDPAVEQHWLLRWYSGPGLSSSFVLLGLPLVYWALRERLLPRWVWCLPLLMVLAGAATFNRMYWPALVLGFAVLALCEPALARLRRLPWFWLGLFALVLAGVATLLLAILYRPGVDLASHDWRSVPGFLARDPRFEIWRAWLSGEAQLHPWTGLGYGKPVVSQIYASYLQQNVAAGMDPNGLTHPHNLFVSVWVQTGFVGLGLFLALMTSVAAAALRLRRHAAAHHVWGAVLALVAILLGKMLTDDFYNRVPAILFWSYLGLMLGAGSASQRPEQHV